MRILVCDDQPETAEKIAGMLEQYKIRAGIAARIDPCSQPQQMRKLSLESYDILFLDVDMETVSGMELARIVRRHRKDAVIVFITNYIEYAPEGYEVQAFRYLLKAELEQKLYAVFIGALEQYRQSHRTLSFSVEGEYIDVALHHVLYLESQKRQIKLHLLQERCPFYQFYGNMSRMTGQLEPLGFLRIHKSYLVNMEYLEKLQYGSAQLKGGLVLKTSEKNFAQIKQNYLAWRAQNKWEII